MVEVTRDLDKVLDDAEGEANVTGAIQQRLRPVLGDFGSNLNQLEHCPTGQLCPFFVNIHKNLFSDVLGIGCRIVGLERDISTFDVAKKKTFIERKKGNTLEITSSSHVDTHCVRSG